METLFWLRLKELCAEKKTTPTAVCKAIGLSTGSPPMWKRGTIPNPSAREKIAEYFGVEPAIFVSEKEKQPPEYEGLSATAIEIAKLADRLPPEYLRIARAQLEALEQSIRAQASDK